MVALSGAIMLLLSVSRLQAQCYGNPQAEASVCGGTPISYTAYTTCPNCTHSWSGTPVSGQGTATATYVFPPYNTNGTHSVYPSVSSFNPNANCSYYDVFQTSVGDFAGYPMPALANGPWNGDTAKTWIYSRLRGNGTSTFNWNYFFSWSVSGGTIISATSTPLSQTWTEDTVRVRWNGSGPMAMTESRSTFNQGTWGWSFNCNWPSQQAIPAYPALAIFHKSVCSGSPATFYTFPFANSTYTWSSSNGSVVGGQGTNSAQIVMAGPGTVTVVRDSAGTITTANLSVTPTVPTISLGPDQTFCQGSSSIISVTGNFSTYAWSTGSTSPSITVTNSGLYSVTASINGSCVASDTVAVTVKPTTPPNLGPDIFSCNAFPVTLNAGAGYTAYAWSNAATTQTTSAPAAGFYRVTVTEANGCQTSDTIQVYNVQPSLSFGADFSYCVSPSYVLNPSDFMVTSYLWSTGATTPTILLNTPGPQTIWVQGSNVYGCTVRDTVIATGLIGPSPNLGPDTSTCPGTPLVLNAGAGFSSYAWSHGPITQTVSLSNPGTYRVTVYDANGCAGRDTIVYSHYSFPAPNLGPDINVCQASATLSPGAGYSAYAWSTGATTAQISVTTPGTYSVTTTSPDGCVRSDAINVYFNNFSFNLGANTTVCTPATVTLNPQLTGSFTYNWNNGATTATQTLSAPGTYNMILVASNTLGCTASDTVQVTILPTLPSALGGDTILCADTSVVLNVGAGFSSYLWSTGATTPSIVASVGGSYRVTATSPNGCVRLDTVNISGLVDCVFPGDVDYDGDADGGDVLALATGMGQAGSIRAAASLQWYGQHASNWLGSIALGSNFKHGDTNGDGVITANDTVAIQNNFGSSHTRVTGITGGDVRLRLVPVNAVVLAGDVAQFDVYYEGLTGGDVDSVHGIAFQIGWGGSGLTALNEVDYSPAWFAPTGNHLNFTHKSGATAQVVVSRTSGVDTTGHGALMRLSFATDPGLGAGQQQSVMPTVSMVQAVGVSLKPRPMQVDLVPATLLGPVRLEPRVLAHVQISPVPASTHLRVVVDGQLPIHVRLVNLLGQEVARVEGNGQDEFELPVAELPAGTYSVQVALETGMISRQVVVAR